MPKGWPVRGEVDMEADDTTSNSSVDLLRRQMNFETAQANRLDAEASSLIERARELRAAAMACRVNAEMHLHAAEYLCGVPLNRDTAATRGEPKATRAVAS